MVEEYLIWRLEAKAFSWPIVEPLHNEFNVIIRNGGEPFALRKVLADQPIHVLV